MKHAILHFIITFIITFVIAGDQFGDFERVVQPGICINPLDVNSSFYTFVSFYKSFDLIIINNISLFSR